MKSSMGKELKIEAGLKPIAKENTLKSKTDVIQNVRSADTPESDADDHGATALRKKRARGGKIDGDKPKFRLDRRARGGKIDKKGTKINIIVAPGAGGPPGGAMPPVGAGAPPMPPPTMVRPPMPPQGAGAGAPMMPPASPGAPPSLGMPPPGMMRKDGGRVGYPLDAGAGGGEGRLEKIRAYGKKA